MNRNLQNINSSDVLDGFNIIGNPTDNNQVLLYNNGSWSYASLSATGEIVSVNTVGTGVSVVNSISAGVLNLRSFLGNQNILCTNTTNEIVYSLSANLVGLNSIESSAEHFGLIIDNSTSGHPMTYLDVICKQGILTSNPVNISSVGEVFLNAITTGTPVNSEFLSIDSNGKIIKSAVSAEATSASNLLSGGIGPYFDEVGNNLRFRRIQGDNINIVEGIGVGNAIQLTLQSQLESISSININTQATPLEFGSTAIKMPYIGSSTNTSASNIIGLDTSGNLKYTSFLNNIDTINHTTPGGTLTINSQNIRMPNIQPIGLGTKRSVYIDGDQLWTGYDCSVVNSLGTFPLVKTNTISTNGLLELYGLSSEGTLDLTVNVENNINIETKPIQPYFTSIGDTGNNLTILSEIEQPNLIEDVTPSYWITCDSDGKFKKTTFSIGANINIYNSDGQLTTATRKIQGLTPGGNFNNKLVLDNLTLSLQNNIAYAPSNVNDNTCSATSILAFDGLTSRAIYAPYSYKSQRFTVLLGGTFGNFKEFASYEHTGTMPNFYYEVEVYETNNISNEAYNATYVMNFNYTDLIPVGTVYQIKPQNASIVNQGANINQCILEVYMAINQTLIFRLKQASRVGLAATYKVFIKHLAGDLINVNTLSSSGTTNLSQNVLSKSTYMTTFFGNGTIPSLLFNYVYFGKDIVINVWRMINSSAGSTGIQDTFNVILNGSIVATQIMFSYKNDEMVAVNIRELLNFSTLINTNILFTNTINTLTFTITGANAAKWLQASNPYRVNIEFV